MLLTDPVWKSDTRLQMLRTTYLLPVHQGAEHQQAVLPRAHLSKELAGSKANMQLDLSHYLLDEEQSNDESQQRRIAN